MGKLRPADVWLVNMPREKMARKLRGAFEPLAHIASRQQPAGYVRGSLFVMNFADEEGLCGPEDFFATTQDGRFGAFDIDLDQAGQVVLPSNSVQSDRFDFDCRFFGCRRVLHKNSTIHAGLKTSSLKTQAPDCGAHCFRNNLYSVELIARSVLFDAPDVRGIRFENKYRTLSTQIPRRNQTKHADMRPDIIEDSAWPQIRQQNPLDWGLIIALKIFHFIAGIEMNPEALAWAGTNRCPHEGVRGNGGTREIPKSGPEDGKAIRKGVKSPQWQRGAKLLDH
jgi:hypothetical protein